MGCGNTTNNQTVVLIASSKPSNPSISELKVTEIYHRPIPKQPSERLFTVKEESSLLEESHRISGCFPLVSKSSIASASVAHDAIK